MIKRLIALTLCLIMAMSVFASCGIKRDKDDKGAIIKMYITEEIYDFDPVYAFKNDSALKIVSLMFSTLISRDCFSWLQPTYRQISICASQCLAVITCMTGSALSHHRSRETSSGRYAPTGQQSHTGITSYS